MTGSGEPAQAAAGEPLLRVEDLQVRFRTAAGILPAVDGVGFELRSGETLGLVGESGSGKTVTSLALLRLLESPPAEIRAGRVLLEGRDLFTLGEREMADVRGRDASMIFQEPMTSLNPVLSVGYQIAEPLVRHLGMSQAAARARTVELLEQVGIPNPARAAADYPHRLSGGMRQRVMIALAIACKPKVLVADEPTTALDVTIQAQILALLVDLQQALGMSMLLITHDLAVIAETAHRVAVMYAGRIVEIAPVEAIFGAPRHPYTKGLLRSIPRIERTRESMLPEIPGTVPSLAALPPGCAFVDRCPRALERCRTDRPELAAMGHGHRASCWNPADA
ncbi:MAG: ABC transporter ATP-binding protein [Alphaproteobacteria bacterium]|nr:ABC transporter ATP-binding protein [Alphaproteobacteria bacterium]